MDFKNSKSLTDNSSGNDIKIRFSWSGLRGRILTVVMIPLAFLIVVAGISFVQVGNLSKSMNRTLDDTLPIISQSQAIQLTINNTLNYLMMALYNKNSEYDLANYIEQTIMSADTMNMQVVEYQKLPMAGDVSKVREDLVKGWRGVNGFISQVKSLADQNKFSDAESIIKDEIRPSLSALIDLTKDIEKTNQEAVVAAKNDATSLSTKSTYYSIGGAILALITSIGISFIFATSISKKFAIIGVNLSHNADQMTNTATQIAAAAQELSEASTEQAASLQETSSAIEETSTMVKKNSENSRNAASTSASSLQKAENGKQVVESMIVSMDNINESNNKIVDQFNESNQKIGEIVELIQVIGKKTKIINEIVFQTKLLSFNASVEAARAGEHGKGFAVVAEEVGNLAQMSGNAAKEITDLLSDSIQKVETIVNESKSRIEALVAEGKETVRVGAEVARECGQVLSEIMQNVSEVSNLVEEISSASQEQADGVQEITKAIIELGQTTQQNAASSADSANGARDLETQAETLRKAIVELNATIQGSS